VLREKQIGCDHQVSIVSLSKPDGNAGGCDIAAAVVLLAWIVLLGELSGVCNKVTSMSLMIQMHTKCHFTMVIVPYTSSESQLKLFVFGVPN